MSPVRLYAGAIHIHTDRSDGGGSLAEIVSAAKESGIDFLVLTDHNTRGYAEQGAEGWNDGVLVLCGEEITTPEAHLLAFETRQTIGASNGLKGALEDLREQCGIAVSIHHQLPSLGPEATVVPEPLPLDQADLIEIWSFTDEFFARVQARYLVPASARPDKLISGPPRALLQRWDRQLRSRRLPMIGGLNVHGKKQPLSDWKVMLPYKSAFAGLVTCILCHDLPTAATRARDIVWSALREGRSFAVNRSVAPEKGFSFVFQGSDGRTRQMGEEVPWDPRGRFYVTVSQDAEVVFRFNGQPYFWVTTREASFPVARPGTYRVEVFLNRRLWILSNPIQLVDKDGVMQPTVSDVT
jgi:hypothetical protein